ncbi:MAG: 4-hydroxythreonine-4-phosphate dehydrogenase PdxA [Blastocatellia bacterium]|nr:4-hydroxythreonine-4-phosphate dehydrogenase PdxA [Blastocatellia bacterium]
MDSKPVIGITIGDAAGIGPEISLKAIDDEICKVCRPVLIGDIAFLRKAAALFAPHLDIVEHGVERAESSVEVYAVNNLAADLRYGVESKEAGKAAGEYIETAVRLWKGGVIDAIATAPINKHSLSLGGYEHPGHTEFLAALTDTKSFAMSFFADDLRVVLLSTHLPLRQAIDKVTTTALVDLIAFTNENLGRLLNKKPKIAVAGLNPHASENGMFGTEEAEHIEPALKISRDEHQIDVHGPFSPDTIFVRGYRGEFDAVIACFHDQATIAVKSLSFGSGVNVTLGLPLVRTSVDHGTAFDIAGRGIADESSMRAAIKLAAQLSSSQALLVSSQSSETKG